MGGINMKTLSTPGSREAQHAHNEIAALLSIIPGLGHIYKGHYEAGLLWMFLGMPIAVWIGCAGWRWRGMPTMKKIDGVII